MTPELFEKFALPTALIIVLLGFIGGTLRMLWTYFTTQLDKKDKELQGRLEEKDKQAKENQDKFLTALANQNSVAAAIAELLKPINSGVEQNLKNTNEIVKIIRKSRK